MSLTKARENSIRKAIQQVDHTIRHPSSTPEDYTLAEEALTEFFVTCGGPLVQKIVWCDSPLSALIAKTVYCSLEHQNNHARHVGNKAIQAINAMGSTLNDRARGFRDEPGFYQAYKFAEVEARRAASQLPWLTAMKSHLFSTANDLSNGRAFPIGKTHREWWSRVESTVGTRIAVNARRRVRDIYIGHPMDERNYGTSHAFLDEIIDKEHLRLDERAQGERVFERGHAGHFLWFADWMYTIMYAVGCSAFEPFSVSSASNGRRLAVITKVADGMICGRDTIFLSRRPERLMLNERSQLHAIDVPAVEYADGWMVCAVNGQNVPTWWFTQRERLTPAAALSWRNIEQRRAAFEILGWDNILKKLDARVINEDADPEIGTLLRVNVPGLGNVQFVRVRCGTGRFFAIPVPNSVQTAKEANAWTYGRTGRDFVPPEVRT